MSALVIGHTASGILLGLSPWFIPLLAVAAKVAFDDTRATLRCKRRPSRPPRVAAVKSEGRADNWDTMDKRFKARLMARVWPE